MAFTSFNGLQLHFESIRVDNVQNDTILIFLHEALGSIPQWRNFPTELCHLLGMNGLVYERQGHGQSDSLSKLRTSSYLHDYAWNELTAFLETILSPEQSIILVGHSDGGTIALLYASKFPKKVKGVITMAAHVINEAETIAGIAPAVEAFEAGKLEKLRSFHGDKTDALFYAWANTWKHPEFASWNICSEISTLTIPSLIIQGEKDQYGTIKQLQLIADNVKGKCQIELIKDCAHHPHLEKSEKIKSLIQNFIHDLNVIP